MNHNLKYLQNNSFVQKLSMLRLMVESIIRIWIWLFGDQLLSYFILKGANLQKLW